VKTGALKKGWKGQHSPVQQNPRMWGGVMKTETHEKKRTAVVNRGGDLEDSGKREWTVTGKHVEF